jgi:hypothetical protein
VAHGRAFISPFCDAPAVVVYVFFVKSKGEITKVKEIIGGQCVLCVLGFLKSGRSAISVAILEISFLSGLGGFNGEFGFCKEIGRIGFVAIFNHVVTSRVFFGSTRVTAFSDVVAVWVFFDDAFSVTTFDILRIVLVVFDVGVMRVF